MISRKNKNTKGAKMGNLWEILKITAKFITL